MKSPPSKSLQETYKAAYKATNGEQAWQTKVIAKKDAKKVSTGGFIETRNSQLETFGNGTTRFR
jgi:hypothetical protein